MSYAEQVANTIDELRTVAEEHDCEVGRAGSYDCIVVGGTGETVRPVPTAVFRTARELGLEAAGVEVGEPTGRPQVGFDFVEPPERGDEE
ncbi:hypothetical protein [Haloglomus salinum]|jgi:hypothetical protein|uniref:hypothetical protein n=1 Tax=Haloglomus salinum TaxID=2962673 RepID=UPI0020C9838A|nr:hypothetical protein [Haloglomus salinum]